MGAHRYPYRNHSQRTAVDELLDFGEEGSQPPSPDLNERIRKVKEKIEEINVRITRLTSGRD